MNGEVLVLTESQGQDITTLSLQLLAKGREMADGLGTKLVALIIGGTIGELAGSLGDKGADEVVSLDAPCLQQYDADIYGTLIANAVQDESPSLFLLGHTYLGIEIGPYVAERLKAPLLTNCIGITCSRQSLSVVRPVLGGMKHAAIQAGEQRPVVLTAQPGAFPTARLASKPAVVRRIAPKMEGIALRRKVKEVFRSAAGEIDIAKADIIVAAGRGIRDRANLRLIEELARALGGVVACSRPLADLGWLPGDRLVGLSGKEVSPRVYIACGISGASQHVAGMKEAQTVIAINKDAASPIFAIARYGFVGDLMQVLPALIEEAGRAPKPWLERR